MFPCPAWQLPDLTEYFLNERNEESRRFAGSCVCDTNNIVSQENMRNGAVLYGRWHGVSFFHDCVFEPLFNSKIGKAVFWCKLLYLFGYNRFVDEARNIGIFELLYSAFFMSTILVKIRTSPALMTEISCIH